MLAACLQVLNNNCRFLQGPETERRKVMEIRDAIREDRCCQVSSKHFLKVSVSQQCCDAGTQLTLGRVEEC